MCTSNNRALADILHRVANQYKEQQDVYRTAAYQRVAVGVENVAEELRDADHVQARVPGVGESIHRDLTEYFTTGTMSRLLVQQPVPQQMTERELVLTTFCTVYGIGLKNAVKFYEQGYRTLAELWYAPLNDKQRTGLYWHNHITQRIPRWEIDYVAWILGQRWRGVYWAIAGSYRREELTSGDIDILVRRDCGVDISRLVEAISPLIVATLASGDTKYMGIMRLSMWHVARRIDIRLINPSSWGCALQYFTGSKEFNVRLRNVAIAQSMSLSEYALTHQGQTIPTATEEDIFTTLSVKYVPPRDRSSTKELVPLPSPTVDD